MRLEDKVALCSKIINHWRIECQNDEDVVKQARMYSWKGLVNEAFGTSLMRVGSLEDHAREMRVCFPVLQKMFDGYGVTLFKLNKRAFRIHVPGQDLHARGREMASSDMAGWIPTAHRKSVGIVIVGPESTPFVYGEEIVKRRYGCVEGSVKKFNEYHRELKARNHVVGGVLDHEVDSQRLITDT